jgi:excisionase family DNA binding protein
MRSFLFDDVFDHGRTISAMEKQLYRLNEVVEILALSRSKIYRLMKAGRLHATHIDGSVRFHAEDLRQFAAEQRNRAKGAE